MNDSWPRPYALMARLSPILIILILVLAPLVLALGYPIARVKADGECSPLDVTLLIDSTSSMSGAIDNVKIEAAKLVDQIVAASGGNYQLGLIEFRDDIIVSTDMASGTADMVRAQIGAITAVGGDGGSEASDEALNTVVNRLNATDRPQSGNFSGVWRTDANKIIILITDAPPAGFDDLYAEGVDNVNAHQHALEASNLGIKISAVYVPTTEGVPAVKAAGANAVNDDSAVIAEAVMRDYQATTNGGFIKTARNGSGTANAISLTIAKCGSPGVQEGLYRLNLPLIADAPPATLAPICMSGKFTPVDIIFALDRSNSFAEKGRLNITMNALRTVLDQMDLAQDQLALVTFARDVTLPQPLTKSKDAFLVQLSLVIVGDGTAIGTAITVSANEVLGSRHMAPNRPVIILLTDGENLDGPDPLPRARDARAKGIRIITVSAGEDVQKSVLRDLASRAADYYYNDSLVEIPDMLHSVVQKVQCGG